MAGEFESVTVQKRFRGVGDHQIVAVNALLPGAYDDATGAVFSASDLANVLQLSDIDWIIPNNHETVLVDGDPAVYTLNYDPIEKSIRAYVYDTEDEAADAADLNALRVDLLVFGGGITDS
jgi:hypothetical protein